MEAVEYMNRNNATTKSLQNLSISLSRLSNDIQNSVNRDKKISTVSFKDDPIRTTSSFSNRLKHKDSSHSVLNDSGYSTMSLRHSLSKTPSSMRYSPSEIRKNHSYINQFSNFQQTKPSACNVYNIGSYSSQNLERSSSALSELTQAEFDAMRYFPVTMGTSYAVTLPKSSFEEPRLSSSNLRSSASRLSRASNSSINPRFQNDYNYKSECYHNNDSVENLHAMIKQAPVMVSAVVPELSPYEEYITKLRLQRLQIEEDRLKELKRQEELENLRGPEPKWYEKKDQSFHYEAHKNTQLVRSQDKWDDLLKQREDLLKTSSKMDTLYSTTPVF